MRILITGAGGQLGRAVTSRFGHGCEVAAFPEEALDVTDGAAVFRAVHSVRPQVVLHPAALTNVDACETDPEAAFRVNALGTRNVAMACLEEGALLVYISTDYVFGGDNGAPYTEFDRPGPINVYGHSKLAGEEYVRQIIPRHLIVRTAWLYSGRGEIDFVHTVLSLLATGREIAMVDDQHGSPTYVPHLAAALEGLVREEVLGTYHLAGTGECSRFEFARAIARLTGRDPECIRPVPTSAFPRPARRPCRTSLRCYVAELEGRPPLPPWEAALEEELRLHVD